MRVKWVLMRREGDRGGKGEIVGVGVGGLPQVITVLLGCGREMIVRVATPVTYGLKMIFYFTTLLLLFSKLN